MGRRRRSRWEDERERRAREARDDATAVPEPAEEGTSPEAAVLALQRSAGNAAVAGLLQRQDFQLSTPELGQSLRQRSRLSLLEGGLTLEPPQPIRLTPQQLLEETPPPPGVDFTRAGTGAREREAGREEAGPRAAELPRGFELDADERSITLEISLRDRPLASLPNYLGTLDILSDPTISMTVDLEPELAAAAEASATILNQHFRAHGREVASLALSATAGIGAEGPSASGSARAEVNITQNAALNFTLTVRPTPTRDGGVDLQFSPVVGAVVRF
jgi:hypothetical protein